MDNKLDNPFSVDTPEQMTAMDINELYVTVPNQSELLKATKHMFLHGHRGSGKSMLFRRMSPDCQILTHKTSLKELSFFGVYLSIKKTGLDVAEYELLDNESVGVMFSEHSLICHLASALFRDILTNTENNNNTEARKEVYQFLSDFLIDNLEVFGYPKEQLPRFTEESTVEHMFKSCVGIFDRSFQIQNNYFKREMVSLVGSGVRYDGPLFGFHDFLIPMIERIKDFSFLPSGPIFFLIDDADNLNLLQTKVLNTWVSYRTYDTVCLKIATQMRYKTYLTLSGEKIENPHDYSEVLASSIYTGKNNDHYQELIKEIVTKRLKTYYGKEIKPHDYFPVDLSQEEKIAEIADEIRAKYDAGEGRGYRSSDDVYRYSRPEYMARISGSSKGGSNYIYCGFNQLIHISSGIIRLFLDPASTMFAEQQGKNATEGVSFIEPAIQNKVLRQESDYLLFSDYEKKLKVDRPDGDEGKEFVNSMIKLRNLIVTVGALFRSILLSDRSERRVFSFAISDYEKMTYEVQSILELGLREGLLYEAYIGSKEQSGRTKLYVLNRRLAPYFKLDPVGFSGYKFVTCAFLMSAINRPKSLIHELHSKGVDAFLDQDSQLPLL